MSRAGFLGLITARGGSRGIPGKNLAPLAGRPLIAWTIGAARRCSCLERVVVSTDDPDIARVSRQLGAEVPFLRPAHLAADDSPHLDTVLHALDWLEENQGYRPLAVVLLQPTSPLRRARDIEGAVKLWQDQKAQCVVSVCPAPSHPYLVKRLDPKGTLVDFVPTPPGYLRRQDLPPALALNGAIYVADPEFLRRERTWFGPRTYPYHMPASRSLDIDTPWDLELAGLILGRETEPA